MFYLKTYFSSLTKKPFLMSFWVLSFLGIMISFYGVPQVSDWLGQESKKQKTSPYFYAVIPTKINANYIKRKVLNLPGVEAIESMESEAISEKVKSVLTSTGVEFDKELLELSYSGLKVELSPDLQPRSQELVRSYMGRLAGEEEAIIGAVKTPLISRSTTNIINVVSEKLNFTPVLFVFFYMVVLLAARKELMKESFLIESFQRKKNVFEKSFFFGQAPLLLVFFVMAFNGFIHVAPMLLIFLTGVGVIFLNNKRDRAW